MAYDDDDNELRYVSDDDDDSSRYDDEDEDESFEQYRNSRGGALSRNPFNTDDDDDDDDSDDEDDFLSRRLSSSSPSSGSSPFSRPSSGGLPGSSRFGSPPSSGTPLGGGAGNTDRDSLRERLGGATSGSGGASPFAGRPSPFGSSGSTPSSTGSSSSGGSPSSPSSASSSSSSGGASPFAGRPSPFGSSGSTPSSTGSSSSGGSPSSPSSASSSSSSGTFGNRPSPFGSSGSTPSSTGSSSSGGSPSSPSSASSSSSSGAFGGMRSTSYGAQSASTSPSTSGAKPEDKKDDKPADKKDEKPASGGGILGGIGSRLSFGKKESTPSIGDLAKSTPPVSKPTDKKDDKPASGGGVLGGVASRFSFGKKDDKPADKKDEKPASGGVLGGVASRFSFGKKDDKPADKKDEKPASGGGVLGGLASRFSFGKKDDKPADKKDDKPAPPSTPSSPMSGSSASSSAFGSRPSIGSSPSTSSFSPSGSSSVGGASGFNRPSVPASAPVAQSAPASSVSPLGAKVSTGTPATSKAASVPAPAPSGGFMSRIGGLFRRGATPAPAPTKPPARSATPKTPTVDTEGGLTLDNWLDIVGIALMFGGLVLFFSAISPEQAAIKGLLSFFGELLGWGALAIPFSMMVTGGWLIVRHFGDEAPKVDPIRLAGALLAFVALLTLFQYVDSFSYPANMDWRLLELRLRYSYEVYHAGGGAIGATIYYALITNVTEIGGFFVVLFLFLIAGMLFTRSSASELLALVVGAWRNMRTSMQQRAIANRAKRQLQEKAKPAPISATSPSPEALPTQAVAQSVLPETATSERGIRLNVGGELQTLGTAPQSSPTAPVITPIYIMASPPPPPEKPASGGIFARLRGEKREVSPPPPPLPITPLPLDDVPLPQPTAEKTGSTPPQSAFTASSTPPPPQSASVGGTFTEQKPAFWQAEPSTVASNKPSYYSEEDETDEDESAFNAITARANRLNELRSGNLSPKPNETPAYTPPPMQPSHAMSNPAPREFTLPPEPSTPPQARPLFGGDVPPSQLPSVQPNMQPIQQNLSVSPIVNQTRAQRPQWQLPDVRTLLSTGSEQEFDRELLLKQAKIIEDTLSSFGAPGRVVEINTGPVITQFGVEPDYVVARNAKKQRVKVGAIATLDKDLQLALGAKSIRVEAPVPGKGYVGIEVPNKEATTVRLRDVMESSGFQKHKTPLAIALGQSVSGVPISADLASMPHLLIAGTTGSGKSVCVNAIIASIISRHSPDEVKFIMVDPKRVELTGYNGIPHLIAPVVVELERIVGVLKWVTREMDDRYKKFSDAGARNIEDYNKHRDPNKTDSMPYIVVIIDELADLMMLAPEETERTITRIAALARATGIHLVIATQRPSVDVVTGLIKANFPARIAFAVAGGVDSRVILDQPGAEKLLGRGDMLYLSGDSPAPLRLQGVYVSDMEIQNIVRYWKMQSLNLPEAKPLPIPTASVTEPPRPTAKPSLSWESAPAASKPASNPFPMGDEDDEDDLPIEGLPEEALTGDNGDEDDMYEKAVELVRRLDKASVSLLQRRLRIGYTRAARLIDVMENRGVVGPAKDGSSKPRDVLQLKP